MILNPKTSQTDLTAAESKTLAAHESIIERGLQAYHEVGDALAAIRDKRLYRQTFPNFEAYCRCRWGMSKTHANRLVEAASVMRSLTPIGVKPANESQTRPLAPVPDDERDEVWQTVIERAPTDKKGHPRISAALVQEVVDRRRTPTDDAEYVCDIQTSGRTWRGLRGCTDTESSQYALGSIEVRTADGDSVYCTATDGRMAAVVQITGSTDGRQLIPGAVVPTRQSWGRVTLNSTWKSRSGSSGLAATEYPDMGGRFPNVAEALPNMAGGDFVAVSLDAEKLANLARAITQGDSATVTLFIPTPEPDTKANQVIPVAQEGRSPTRCGWRLAHTLARRPAHESARHTSPTWSGPTKGFLP